MAGLSREVVKWVQSLDLAWQIKVPQWDLSNGYLVGEIFASYYDDEIQRRCLYSDCECLERKQFNWSFIKKFIKAKRLHVPEELIQGTIHCKEGAAILLLECLYEILTERKVKKVPPEMKTDFTDYPYQVKLPMHARSTASTAIKNNLRLTEILEDKNNLHIADRSMKIINDHIDHRRLERLQDPKRFDVKPTLGEQCVRKAPRQISVDEETNPVVSKQSMQESGVMKPNIMDLLQ